MSLIVGVTAGANSILLRPRGAPGARCLGQAGWPGRGWWRREGEPGRSLNSPLLPGAHRQPMRGGRPAPGGRGGRRSVGAGLSGAARATRRAWPGRPRAGQTRRPRAAARPQHVLFRGAAAPPWGSLGAKLRPALLALHLSGRTPPRKGALGSGFWGEGPSQPPPPLCRDAQ